jgi:zinc transport system permease protein
MLSLPILIAEIWCKRFMSIMLTAIVVSAVSCIGGLLIATVIDVPCSAIIVLMQTLLYAVARVVRDITH